MKFNVRSTIRQAAFNRHISIERLNSKPEIDLFLSRFRENYVGCNLVRVGGSGDGGYLLPDILHETSYCFSPGVDYTAKFEKELSDNFSIESFMADASVNSAPHLDPNFKFYKRFLGSHVDERYITLSHWIKESNLTRPGRMILQMDIEGGEYDVLVYEDMETLANFSVLVIEFHNLEKLFEKHFLKMVSSIFNKLYQNFKICHAHPNNCGGIASLDGIEVPRVLEITFVRNDLVDRFATNTPISLPHSLDCKNVAQDEDIVLPNVWWLGD